jgi:hypothetical protein
MASDTITFVTDVPSITLTALLDTDGAKIVGGYGGWEVITRPRRQGITNWAGRSPFSMTIAIILDGFAQDRKVDTDWSKLERLSLPHPNPGGEPPVVELRGDAIPHSDLLWVVDNIDPGETILDQGGNMLRRHAVVSLIRYVAMDRIQLSAAANARNKGQPSGSRNIEARAGDSLSKIASRELGDSKRWKEIQTLNPNIRDPNRITVGTDIKIPPKVKHGS